MCIKVFRDVIPCSFIERYKPFEETSNLHRLPQSRRQQVPSKCWYLFTKLQDVTSWNTTMHSFATTITSEFKSFVSLNKKNNRTNITVQVMLIWKYSSGTDAMFNYFASLQACAKPWQTVFYVPHDWWIIYAGERRGRQRMTVFWKNEWGAVGFQWSSVVRPHFTRSHAQIYPLFSCHPSRPPLFFSAYLCLNGLLGKGNKSTNIN
jgi:hypothetical protein